MVKKGQHFLVDHSILLRLAEAGYLRKRKDIVWEPGTGVGTLTRYIARRCKLVYTVEIDYDIYQIAKEKLSQFNNVFMILGDAIEVPIFDDVNKIVCNPPFEITSPLLNKIVKFLIKQNGELAVLTMQKEVADKLFAKPGKKLFGSISFFVQYYCKVEYLFRIPRRAYSPPPHVDIVAVRLFPKKGIEWDEELNKFIRLFYKQKKWDVKKILKEFFPETPIDTIPSEILKKKCFQLPMEEVLEIYKKWKENKSK